MKFFKKWRSLRLLKNAEDVPYRFAGSNMFSPPSCAEVMQWCALCSVYCVLCTLLVVLCGAVRCCAVTAQIFKKSGETSQKKCGAGDCLKDWQPPRQPHTSGMPNPKRVHRCDDSAPCMRWRNPHVVTVRRQICDATEPVPVLGRPPVSHCHCGVGSTSSGCGACWVNLNGGNEGRVEHRLWVGKRKTKPLTQKRHFREVKGSGFWLLLNLNKLKLLMRELLLKLW